MQKRQRKIFYTGYIQKSLKTIKIIIILLHKPNKPCFIPKLCKCAHIKCSNSDFTQLIKIISSSKQQFGWHPTILMSILIISSMCPYLQHFSISTRTKLGTVSLEIFFVSVTYRDQFLDFYDFLTIRDISRQIKELEF